MQKQLLATNASPDLRVFVVWLPVLNRMSPEALESAAGVGAKRIPDERVKHYLDPEARLGEVYAPILRLRDEPWAWDVYLAFPATAPWDEKPPAPAYWMHQLYGGPPERHLKGKKLAAEVENLLAAAGR